MANKSFEQRFSALIGEPERSRTFKPRHKRPKLTSRKNVEADDQIMCDLNIENSDSENSETDCRNFNKLPVQLKKQKQSPKRRKTKKRNFHLWIMTKRSNSAI